MNSRRTLYLGEKVAGYTVMGAVIVFAVGCRNLPSKSGDTPITAERTVEYLDLTPGEIPQWKKRGEITLPIEGQ